MFIKNQELHRRQI